MKGIKLMAVLLLVIGFCFISASGQAVIRGQLVVAKVEAMRDYRVALLDYILLQARVDYMMNNPDTYQRVSFGYDMDGSLAGIYGLPENVNTGQKIFIVVYDHREFYSPNYLSISGWSLLEMFEVQLSTMYGYIEYVATDMDGDIVAGLLSKEGVKLAYFYKGEYYLWEDDKTE